MVRRTKQDDRRSDAAKLYRLWYKTPEWQVIREQQLAIEPYCRPCAARNVQTIGTVCDHVEPHRGDRFKFFNGPFQTTCTTCHNSGAQSRDLGGVGFDKGCDEHGFPLPGPNSQAESGVGEGV